VEVQMIKRRIKKKSNYDGVDQNFSQEHIYMDVYMAVGKRTCSALQKRRRIYHGSKDLQIISI
jgi:hypothetical protein